MTAYFLDTSSLARRYIPTETGSAWVKSWIDPAARNLIMISELTTVEMMSVLDRCRHERSISAANFNRLRDDFLKHFDTEYLVVTLSSEILRQARDLVPRHSLRALDAIQLACALHAAQVRGAHPLFICADRRLSDAAAAEGFQVDDPNAHP